MDLALAENHCHCKLLKSLLLSLVSMFSSLLIVFNDYMVFLAIIMSTLFIIWCNYYFVYIGNNIYLGKYLNITYYYYF